MSSKPSDKDKVRDLASQDASFDAEAVPSAERTASGPEIT